MSLPGKKPRRRESFEAYVRRTLQEQNRAQERQDVVLQKQNEDLTYLKVRAQKTCQTIHGEDGHAGLAQDVHDLKRRDQRRMWLERAIITAFIAVAMSAIFQAVKVLTSIEPVTRIPATSLTR